MTNRETLRSLAEREAPWRQIRGDGSDRLPVGTWYDAQQRNGKIERQCCVTTFCIGMGGDLFRHVGKPIDIIAIRVLPAIGEGL